jgi:hypothetical protein
MSAAAFRWTASSGIVRLGSADGYNASYATDMSADGSVVVGTVYVGSLPAPQTFPIAQAFRWTEQGGFAVLGSPARESSSMGSSVASADGTMVAGWYGPVSGQVMFRWTQATGMVTLDPPGVAAAVLTGLSADGSVVIGQTTSSPQSVLVKAFRWKENGGWTALDPGTAYASAATLISADGSVVVGTAHHGWEGQPNTFRWKEGSDLEILSDLPGQKHSRPVGISDDGSVIVGTAFGEGLYVRADETLAFRWTEAAGTKALELMPHPASVKSWNRPVLVSAAGTTVIGFDSSSSDDAGLLTDTTLVAWDEQGSPQPIRFCLPGADGVPAEVSANALELMAISASGAVVAGVYKRGDNRYGWIAHLR